MKETYKKIKKIKSMKYPDAKKHQQISFLKSGIRIVGYIFLPIDIASAAVLLIISEIIGIIEELV
jgi:hypothetical protein